ncbi:MAG: Uma2 family endonuclease [Alkalinema sp. RU_4_3]|nr:Uma2 family endonuclease [Alkalinema sp. RU_4_3]
MTVAKASPQFKSFEEYLAADPWDLPEGRHEYWDGELVPVMTEGLLNHEIASYLYFLLVQAGMDKKLVHPGGVEVAVPGRPRTRFPDLTVLDEVHLATLQRRATVPPDGPPPQMVVEVVSPGRETSANYRRDYETKRDQYANRGIPEYWIVDPGRHWVMVGTLVDGAYQFATFVGPQVIVSPTFPGLGLTAEVVLAG